MVRWKQDNEAGGLQLPGTGYIWTNNVDTIHNMWTSIVSDRVLNEVRGQWSATTISGRPSVIACSSIAPATR
jgi:hypothetical protein